MQRAGHRHGSARREFATVINSHQAVTAVPAQRGKGRVEKSRLSHRIIVTDVGQRGEVKDGLRTFVLHKWYNIYLK